MCSLTILLILSLVCLAVYGQSNLSGKALQEYYYPTPDQPVMVKVSTTSKCGIFLGDVPPNMRQTIINRYVNNSSLDTKYWLDRAEKHYTFTWYVAGL